MDDTPENSDTQGTESDKFSKKQDTMDGENRNEHNLASGEGDWKGAESSYMVCDREDV